jgi:uncharacterized membrane protein YgdD (TMEM256/DUF423 family)
MNNKGMWIIISGIMGFLAVAIGAFGAHGLDGKIPDNLLQVYKTGVTYHLVHAVCLLAISLTGNEKYFKAAAFFLIGIILFSFSLYVYAITAVTAIAIITPFGGVSFLIGWILIAVEGFKSIKSEEKN